MTSRQKRSDPVTIPDICAAEETCKGSLTCPAQLIKSSPSPGSRALPAKFRKIRNLWNGTVGDPDKGEAGIMKIVKFPKELIQGDANDLSLAYVGFKTHNEKTEAANTFLAFRCPDKDDCPAIPFKSTNATDGPCSDPEEPCLSDLETAWDDTAGEYVVKDPTSPDGNNPRQHMVRAVLLEDRIIPLKFKFFCDRTTEKTVTLTLTDQLDKTTAVKTRKISCQYPIFAVQDLSADHDDNKKNNSWSLMEAFPSDATILANPSVNKTYKARLWVRENEEIVFAVKFGKGSHMSITWTITVPASEDDNCLTGKKPTGITEDIPTQDPNQPGKTYVEETDVDKPCKFPFRYRNVQVKCSYWREKNPNLKLCSFAL